MVSIQSEQLAEEAHPSPPPQPEEAQHPASIIPELTELPLDSPELESQEHFEQERFETSTPLKLQENQ